MPSSLKMSPSKIGVITEQQLFSEFYMALLGEQCLFTAPSVKKSPADDGFRVVEESAQRYLSDYLEVQLNAIVDLSNCVKAIELWKQRQTYTAPAGSNQLPQNSRGGDRVLDTVKKAIVESIIADYNVYLTNADQMRVEHLKQKQHGTIEELLAFVFEWRKRLRYLRHLINRLDECSGIEMMNLLFAEWTTQCMRDWNYGLIEQALLRGSIVLHSICKGWLMDAQLPRNTRWFIRALTEAEQQAKLTSNKSRTSIGSMQNCSLNSTHNDLFNQSSTTLMRNINKREKAADNCSKLVLPVQIDVDVVPETLRSTAELIGIILDIGMKVHFLKVLRSERSYKYQLDERRRLLDCLSPGVWFIPSERGQLVFAVHQMYAIVNEDMMQELLGRQRLVDHLSLAHAYFFMLRGDLLAQLERNIFIETPANGGKSNATPFSSCRKGSSSASKIAEKYLSDALTTCSPPMEVADLMSLLGGERLPRNKLEGKYIYELFSMSIERSRCRNGQKGPDGQKLSTSAVEEFFSRDVLRVYKKVFSIACNMQLQRVHLSITWHQFVRGARQRLEKREETQSFSRFIIASLHSARLFLGRLANYIFEEVLLLESTSIFESIQRATNPHGLLYQHQDLLAGIITALFIFQKAAPVNNAMMDCFRKANALVEAVKAFCEALPADADEPVLLEHDDNQQRYDEIIENADGRTAAALLSPALMRIHDENNRQYIERFTPKRKKSLSATKSVDSSVGPKRMSMSTLCYAIRVRSREFVHSQASFRDQLEQFMQAAETAQEQKSKPKYSSHSSYWTRLHLLLRIHF